jgi:hypothetical protein
MHTVYAGQWSPHLKTPKPRNVPHGVRTGVYYRELQRENNDQSREPETA